MGAAGGGGVPSASGPSRREVVGAGWASGSLAVSCADAEIVARKPAARIRLGLMGL